MVNQEFKVRANAIDRMSLDKRKDDAKELFADMMTKNLRANVSKTTGMNFNKQGFLPETMEEIELFMQMNYKDPKMILTN